MVATEAKYHTNYLAELCNKYRDFWKRQTDNDDETDLIQDILNIRHLKLPTSVPKLMF